MIRRALLPGAVLYAGCLAGPASAQYVLAFQDYNAPHIMCKAWERGSNTFLASGEAPNERPSGERFGYYAKKYGEETGKDLNYDCERFENITPDFRRTWEPGETYQGDSGDTYTLAKAPFLPDNWSTTPTPDEIEREAAQKKAEANAPRWVVCSTYDRAANMRYVGIVIETVAAKVPDEPSEQWVAALKAKKLLRSSSEATGECKVENTADAAQSRRADYLKFDPDFSGSIQQVHWALPGGTVAEANDAGGSNEETGSAEPAPPKKSAAEIAAEERAAREAQREAEFKAKQDEYERQLVDRERRVEEFNRLTAEMERQKEANRLEAEQQLADYQKKMSEHSEQIRQHDADVAAYERQVAATKLRKDFDERNGLKSKGEASTDDDANRCVSLAEVKQNASFTGNTGASIVNGCGKPVDVRVCLMTESKGWNCGVQWGVAPQGTWSYSSFHATGQVFVDARTTGSSRPLATPN